MHGPVYVSLYKKYADNGSSLIYSMESEEEASRKFDEEMQNFLNCIFEEYGKLDGDELEELSHKTLAWQSARGVLSSTDVCTNPINDIDIFNTVA